MSARTSFGDCHYGYQWPGSFVSWQHVPYNTKNTKMESPTTTTVGESICVLFYYGLPGMTQVNEEIPNST